MMKLSLVEGRLSKISIEKAFRLPAFID